MELGEAPDRSRELPHVNKKREAGQRRRERREPDSRPDAGGAEGGLPGADICQLLAKRGFPQKSLPLLVYKNTLRRFLFQGKKMSRLTTFGCAVL